MFLKYNDDSHQSVPNVTTLGYFDNVLSWAEHGKERKEIVIIY